MLSLAHSAEPRPSPDPAPSGATPPPWSPAPSLGPLPQSPAPSAPAAGGGSLAVRQATRGALHGSLVARSVTAWRGATKEGPGAKRRKGKGSGSNGLAHTWNSEAGAALPLANKRPEDAEKAAANSSPRGAPLAGSRRLRKDKP